jgi:hypothetical protein
MIAEAQRGYRGVTHYAFPKRHLAPIPTHPHPSLSAPPQFPGSRTGTCRSIENSTFNDACPLARQTSTFFGPLKL